MANRQHHKSKKKHYTIVLVPNEDSGKSKSLRISLGRVITLIIFLVFFATAFVLFFLTYTPVGRLFPLSNRGLEEKYKRDLVVLNQRMLNVMNQLVELRARNIKLRKVLGEKIIDEDIKIDSNTITGQNNFITGLQNMSENINGDIKNYREMQSIFESKKVTNAISNKYPSVSFPAILPTEGYVTRAFEPERNHFGIDIAGKTGSLILAAADGNIVFSGWTYDDGFIVIISHSGGFLSFYKHNQSLLKTMGTFVRRGEPIATLGSSGKTSSGPHLHFEIWKDGVPVDPSIYILNINL